MKHFAESRLDSHYHNVYIILENGAENWSIVLFDPSCSGVRLMVIQGGHYEKPIS
jgi:hypothetical protein